MPIAFKNFLQVSAQLLLTPTPIVNLDGTGLKMEWNIERTRSSTPDRGTIMIYNLGTAARKAIHETWKQLAPTLGYILEFSIGWENLVERIFVGDAWKLVPEIRVGEDVLTVFEVGDGNKGVRDGVQPIAANMSQGQIDFILLTLVEATVELGGLGLPIDPASRAVISAKAKQSPFPKFDNYAGTGNTADQVDELIDQLGLEWKIYNGSFIVTDKGNAATASPIATLLSAKTGLLTWAQEDDGGIVVTALANPNVKPGSQISVIDSFGIPVGAPAHRVDKVSFFGTTDGESLMEIVGRKALLI